MHVAEVIGPVSENVEFLPAEQGGTAVFNVGVIFQFAQTQVRPFRLPPRFPIKQGYVRPNLRQQIIPVRQNQNIPLRNRPPLHQQVKQFHQLHQNNRLARTGRHPERHPVNKMDKIQFFVIVSQGVISGQQFSLRPARLAAPVNAQAQIQVGAEIGVPLPKSPFKRLCAGVILQPVPVKVTPQRLDR